MKRKFPPPAPPELVLIVDPKARLRVRNGEITSIENVVDVRPLRTLLAFAHAAITPLYGVSEDWLQRRMGLSEKLMGIGQPLDLSLFYKITAPAPALAPLVFPLQEISFIQAAYIKPGVELTIFDNSIESVDGIDPGLVTKDFSDRQVYLKDVVEGGIGVNCAWAKQGGRGANVNIIDVEGAWQFSHEDLLQNMFGLISGGGVPTYDSGWRNHGTAVLGVVGGDVNTFGVTGICPEASVRTTSVFGNANGDPVANWSAAAAIRLAADSLRPGDIILIEHHLPGPVADFRPNDAQFGYIPIEWWPCNLAAILYATTRGIIVVEAAGNGRQNLDDPVYSIAPSAPHGPFPDWWRNPFADGSINSGAIVVGAGFPPLQVHGIYDEADRSRVEASNFGSRVDTQAWGDNVVTCGYGGLIENVSDEDRWYTSRFNGTSSAAAMIAGAVGCLQGIMRARGTPLDPVTLRTLLRNENLNSPQADGPFGHAADVHIGPRPNLCNLIDYLVPQLTFLQKTMILIKTGKLMWRS